MNSNTLSVTELNIYIKQLVANDEMLSHIYVKGEISNLKSHSSGHIYLTLKDESSVLRAVMFRSNAMRLKFRPENGMKIIAGGRVSVFERDGQYQLYIEDMQPDGIGALHIAFEQLKKKLENEGLLAGERKKRIPKIPKTIAIITAPTGAAVRDMINIIKRRFPYVKIVIFPVLVQGPSAPGEIIAAIDYVNRNVAADVIIAGRGGGSIEDLWAFNDEGVARSIAASKIPVVSAVGHETDFTIADFVADLRAPTPSAAAEMVVPNITDVTQYLLTAKSRLIAANAAQISKKHLLIDALYKRIEKSGGTDIFNSKRMIMAHIEKNLASASNFMLNSKRQRFTNLAAKLEALSPLSVLSRGYALVSDRDKKPVTSIHSINLGEKIDIALHDGNLACEVLQIVEGEIK